MNKSLMTIGTLALAGCVSMNEGVNNNACFGSWPRGASPEEVGARIAERFLAQPHSQYGRFGKTPKQKIGRAHV